ncbi:hypothetical protein PHMEG_00024291 [Phytophthora megakarya]|uniref:Uncharacterized protein n=1 Tax=Phytophthora megakarya TaxID=4795 RepID=A0A225VF14_9STRA|nr:hypothetical protein PHMEG_00024291 [Phytophthora megakarya]
MDESTSSSTVPFFVPLIAPIIESTSYAALVEWRKRRKEYEHEVAVRAAMIRRKWRQ